MSRPPTNKGRRFPAEPLSPEEVRALIGAASGRSSAGVRMRALIAVMFGAGLRLAETLALYPRDIDLDNGTIRVRNGKGNKARLVGIDPHAAGLVAAWAERRSALRLNGRHPLFATYEIGKRGKPMDPRYVRAALARLAERAGVEKRVHPHGLRHSLAFDLAMSGVPTHTIQAQLGHASLAVTDRYVKHLAPADVVGVMQSRDWS
jgi:integrase/recombinase XerD